MLTSFATRARRIAAISAATVLSAFVVVPAATSKPVPGPNVPAVQDLLTQGHNWAAKARLLDGNGGILRANVPSAQDLRTQGMNWAAKGRLLNADGGLLSVRSQPVGSGSRFHWNDFGIGAGVAFALVLLLGIVAAGLDLVRVGSREGRTA